MKRDVETPLSAAARETTAGGRAGLAELAPGTVLKGRYRIERLLGRGGLGSVYLAADLVKGGNRVALKMLQPTELTDEQVALLKNEFGTMARLSHPNIAAAYDFESVPESGAHFLTMEYVEGAPLEPPEGGVPWRPLLDVVVQVCRALAYMHSRSVIHFDLKPGNILVMRDGKAKVLDFGLAGARAYQAGKGKVFASPAYMAPELVLAPASADHRVDLYSLGIILYQMLTGRLPFAGGTLKELLRAHCYVPVEFRTPHEQAVPAWLRRIVIRLCAKNPSDRFHSANAVIEAINREGGLTYEVDTRQTRESYLVSSRFVAREQELAAVLGHVEAILSGNHNGATALFVTGVSGIGKSRLLREVRYRLQLARRSFVEVNCYERSLSEFGPIVEAVRHLVALAESRGDERIAAFGPELAQLDPQLAREKGWEAAAGSDNPQADRRRLVQRVAEFFLEAAGEGVTLYVNDLQWALPGTVDILAWLLRRLAARWAEGEAVRFCLIGSYREDELAGTPIERLLQELRAQRRCREIVLPPLAAEHVGEMLASMLGIESPPAWFVHRVHEESGGNPYFVEELMRMLVESGDVFVENGRLVTKGSAALSQMPHTVADALMKRFSLLDADHRALMERLAIHARPVPVRVLHAIAGGEKYDLQRKLNTLLNRRMVALVPGEEPAYRVAHDRLRESVHDATPAPRRKEIHRELMRGLADAYAGREEEVIYDLARHAWEAGEMEHARAYSLRAGNKAYREFANELGITLFQRALELLPDDAAETRRDVLEKLGHMYFLTGAYDRAMACYEEVLREAREPLARARLRRHQAAIYYARGDLRSAEERLWEAADLLGGEHPRSRAGEIAALAKHVAIHLRNRFVPALIRRARGERERARNSELAAIYNSLTYLYYFRDPPRVLLAGLMMANCSETVGESPELSHAYSTLGPIYALLGEPRGARRYGAAAIQVAQQLRIPLFLGQAYNLRGVALFSLGALDEALSALERAREILRDCGDMFELEVCYLHLSYIHMFHGKYPTALATATEGLSWLEKTGAFLVGKTLMMCSGLIKTRMGAFQGVWEDMEKAIEMSRRTGDILNLTKGYAYFGQCLTVAGEWDRAIEQLEKGRKLRETHGVVQDYTAGIYAYLARAHWGKYLQQVGDRSARMGPQERRRLRRYGRKALWIARLGHPNYLPTGHIARGLSLWADGKKRAARRQFRRSIAAARVLGADMWEAECLFEAGRCLLLSSETKTEGLEYLHQAERLLAEQGFRPYLEQTRKLLAQAAAA